MGWLWALLATQTLNLNRKTDSFFNDDEISLKTSTHLSAPQCARCDENLSNLQRYESDVISGLSYQNITILNDTSSVIMTIISDALSCGVTYNHPSDNSIGVIYGPRAINYAPREHLSLMMLAYNIA
jgi:hypothetical protein